MKTFKNIIIAGLAGMVMAFTLSSCQKGFDASSYKPKKPLPSYNGFSSSKDIEPASLVSYFPFTGSTTDSVGNLTGTTTGAITFGNGVSGKDLQGAADAYVVYSNPGTVIPALTSYTVSFWMNTANAGGLARGIFSLNNPTDFWGSLDIYLDNPPSTDPKGDTLIFKVHMANTNVPWSGVFVQSKVPKAISTWTHMLVSYDAGTSVFNIYQNGTAIGVSGVGGTTGFVTSPVIPGDDPTKTSTLYGPLKFPGPTAMVLGTWQFQTNPSLTTAATAQSWAGSFMGGLDNFRIYSKALSAAEVTALYNLEKAAR